jgi:hypothetical protein
MTVAARGGHKKGSPLPKTADTKASYPSELGITTALVLPPASLGHPATSPSLPSVPFLAEQAVPPSSSTTLLTVKIRQPSHEFTFGVGMSFIPYPLVLTPVV